MSFLSSGASPFAFGANERSDATRESFEDREVLLSVVALCRARARALWEAEEGYHLVSFCISLLGVTFLS